MTIEQWGELSRAVVAGDKVKAISMIVEGAAMDTADRASAVVCADTVKSLETVRVELTELKGAYENIFAALVRLNEEVVALEEAKSDDGKNDKPEEDNRHKKDDVVVDKGDAQDEKASEGGDDLPFPEAMGVILKVCKKCGHTFGAKNNKCSVCPDCKKLRQHETYKRWADRQKDKTKQDEPGSRKPAVINKDFDDAVNDMIKETAKELAEG